jgi:hypothetical protein
MSSDAALFFLSKQNTEEKECINTLKSDPNGKLAVVNSKDLSKQSGKVLVCVDLTTKPLSEFKNCHFSYTVPGAVSKLSRLLSDHHEIIFPTRFMLTNH